jgi:hypothetical protein
MRRKYKNRPNLSASSECVARKYDMFKEALNHADYLPKTISYEDIDIAFKDWVENEMRIFQDGIELPTMTLFSNQRFSEYMQSWKYTDENNNIRMNFKTITRENNPNHGTIVGDTYNIPNNGFYLIKSLQVVDKSGKRFKIDYKVKQPIPIDFRYKISIMTNRYTTLNKFNELIHTKFNALQNYISPNGHYMSVTLENISDESEYNISDRQFFSQSFNVLVKGYIVRGEDMIVEENPIAANIFFTEEGKRPKAHIELSEYDPILVNDDIPYYKKDIDIDVDISYCFPKLGNIKFNIDEDFILTGITFLPEGNNIVKENIKLLINDELITHDLTSDSFEGYVPLSYVPEDSNKNNTLLVSKIPEEKNTKYKYLLYDDVYYKWHMINFKNGDEIIIKTNRINRYIKEGSFTLHGYNTFTSHKYEELTQNQIQENLRN